MKILARLLLALALIAAPAVSLANSTTTNLGLNKPSVGADSDAWGAYLNTNADTIDAEYARTTVGDASYSILAADRFVALTSTLTTARTWTLPAATTHKTGQPIVILDEAAGVSVTNTLTIARAGSDTINGATSLVLSNPRQVVVLRSDGTSKWTASIVGTVTSWTPVPTFATAGDLTTVFSQDNGSVVQIVTVGGNVCYATFSIVTTTFTFSTAAGAFQITGIPISAISGAQGSSGGLGNWAGLTGLTSVPVMTITTSTIGMVYGTNASASATASNFTSGVNITLKGNILYRC